MRGGEKVDTRELKHEVHLVVWKDKLMNNGRRSIATLIIGFFIVLAGGTALWFCSDGIHTIGPFVHLEMTADCWLYDPAEETVGDKIIVRLSGYGYTCDLPFDEAYGCGAFDGAITTDAFPMQGEQGITLTASNGGLQFNCVGRIFYNDAQTGMIRPGFDSQSYGLAMDRSGRFLMNVTQGAPGLTIVHADSPEHVPAVYRELAEQLYNVVV